jgi:glycosyltransferase involved in cell wall biosynthesis
MPCASRPVVVLVPVYNGAAYLAAQLDSILEQSHPAVYVLCRDDGSTDGSMAVLEAFQRKWPARIQLVKDGLGNLGASGSFAHLMRLALGTALPPDLATSELPPYFALSDQDDIWHPDKLAVCAAHLEALEQAHPGLPAVVHSDLRVVAQDGALVAPSMARYQGLQAQRQSLAAQLLSNTLTGCTSLMNRLLIEASLPVPPQAIMHDWWLSLVASAWGVREYIDTPLIDYRQHAGNAIGAKQRVVLPMRRWRIQRLFDKRHAEIFQLNGQQASAFLKCYGKRLSLRNRGTLWIVKCLAIPFPPLQRVIFRLLRGA